MHGCAWDVTNVDGHWETHDYNPLIWPHYPEDGTLLTFGQNDKGQLGHSSNDDMVPVSSRSGACSVTWPMLSSFLCPRQFPLEVGLPDPIKAVSAGERHTLCVSSEHLGMGFL